MTEFQDKVVLVLGAGSGLGREVVRAFAGLGAIVAANDLNPLGLNETLSVLGPSSQTAEYVYDIAKKMPLQALVENVLRDWERIDVLINTAAVRPRAAILDMDEWDWHRTLDFNLGGCFFAMQQVGRVMFAQSGGAIVNVVSSPDTNVNQSAFAASQAGMVSLTQFAGREFAPFGIRVNAVFLGTTLAESGDKMSALDSADDGRLKKWQGYPQAVGWILYLASSQAQVFGQVINVKAD